MKDIRKLERAENNSKTENIQEKEKSALLQKMLKIGKKTVAG